MHRHFIAGAFACFGSSLFGQAVTSPLNQTQGALNNTQNTLQSAAQGATNLLDQAAPRVPFQNQYSNIDSSPNSGAMQNRQGSHVPNSMPNPSMGQSSQSQNHGGIHTLRTDANGREFICVNGRSIYFDNANSVSTQGTQNTATQYRAGYGNYDLPNGQNPSSQSSAVDPTDKQETTKANENNNASPSLQPQGQPMQTSQPQPLQSQNNGMSYTLRMDTAGREFICVNGRPVYFDNTPSVSAQPNSTPSSPIGVQPANNQQPSGSIQSTVEEKTNSLVEDPARTRNTSDGTRDASPSSDRLTNPGQNDSKVAPTDRAPKADLGKDTDAVVPPATSSKKTDLPKS